jgi:small subunit ribosomal protein S6
MTEFETIYITKADLDDTAVQALGEKIRGICSRSGSHLLHHSDWGVRKLAYEINKQRRGRYFFVNYLGANNMVPEVERNLRYDEKVLRYLTVRVAAIEDVDARLDVAKNLKVVPAPQEASEVSFTRGRGGRGGRDGGNDYNDYGAGDMGDGPDHM